jgi:hypothetical protein
VGDGTILPLLWWDRSIGVAQLFEPLFDLKPPNADLELPFLFSQPIDRLA